MNRSLSLLLSSLAYSFFLGGSLLDAEPVPKLVLLWETEPIFSYPECAVYDPEQEVVYISNIGETPKDVPPNGDGFVSVMNLDGSVKTLKWIQDLNDPKGMDIWKDTLWVNDRDAIVEVDIPKDQVQQRHELDDVVFLNDIGVGPRGQIYSNDADGHKVLAFKNGTWDVFWEDPDEGRPNGVWVEEDRILLAMNWSHQLISMDTKTMEQTVLLDNIGAADGIEPVGNGGYLITDYLGQVFYLSPSGKGTVLLDSRGEQHTADLEYIPDQQLVIIPRHKNHTVAAYRLNWD